MSLYHKSGIVLLGLAPAAVLLSPTSLNAPLDYLLAIIVPFHSHVGLSAVVTDYVPKAYRTLARAGVLGASIITFAGLIKLNIKGPGITETVKSVWKKED
jgi:succinate dehydrogenase (ubiquinone) membrane anchor subunit